MKRYAYKPPYTSPLYFSTLGGGAILSGLLIDMLHDLPSGEIPLRWALVLWLLPAMLLGGGILIFFVLRPVGITDEGIATFLFGKMRLTAWPKISKVEKVRRYDTSTMRMKSEIRVYVGRRKVAMFNSYIDDFDRLIDKLNIYIAQYNIPAFDINQERESLLTPIAGVAELAQGKSLDGVSTPKSKFDSKG